MSKQSFRVSATGRQRIKEARKRKGWKISQDDLRPLQAASLFIIREYPKVNQIKCHDRAAWSRNLNVIFGLKKQTKREKIDLTKVELIKSSDSCLKIIEKLIYEEEIYPAGISYGTWARFCSRSKQKPVRESAFITYCYILDLDWKEIAEPVIKSPAKSTETEINAPSQSIAERNLVTLNCTKFNGRSEQIKLLLQYLADDRIYQISLEGIDGVGKTTLILEAAYQLNLKT